jgi:hypothetical protein
MGSFFGSVHMRTSDQGAVHQILEELTRKRETRFLLAPPRDGWLTVFPENHGQDDALVKALAKRFIGEMLHVLVHDDDIFAYSLFRNGKLVDHYNSRPDYFEKVSARARQQSRGRPERLEHLLADPTTLPDLQELLTHGRDAPPVFASELLGRFADLFRLHHALSSYEYLMQGEREGIEDWDQFVHVPDRSAEIAEAEQAEAALAQAKQQLRASGLLLVEQTGANLVTMPAWCPDRDGSGFLVTWIDLGNQPGPFPIERVGPPWSSPGSRTGLTVTQHDRWLTLSPSGRYLAVGGFNRTQVWALDQKTMTFEVPCERMVTWLGFSTDEKYLVMVAPEEIVVCSIDGGRRASAFTITQANLAAMHPSGQLVVADNFGKLSIADILSGEVHRKMFLGGRHVPTTLEARLSVQAQQIDVDAMIAQARAMLEQQLKGFGKRQPKASIETMGEELEKRLETMREQLQKHKHELTTKSPPQRGREQIYQLLISRDGQWLFTTSSGGVRVFSWNDFATCNDPSPVFFLEPETLQQKTVHGTFNVPGYYYGVAHDESANRLLFAGGTGLVHSLNLASGQSDVLVELPGRPPIHRLGLSRDASFLCCTCAGKIMEEHGNNRTQSLQIWNYAELKREELAAI